VGDLAGFCRVKGGYDLALGAGADGARISRASGYVALTSNDARKGERAGPRMDRVCRLARELLVMAVVRWFHVVGGSGSAARLGLKW